MSSIKDLQVLEKYLSEEELKEVAKEVAKNAMQNSLGEQNPYAKNNAEFYMKEGFLLALYKELETDQIYTSELVDKLKEKVEREIFKMSFYQLPPLFNKIVEQAIAENESVIKEKINSLTSDFVNSENYPSAWGTFKDHIGEQLGDMLYGLLEQKFKK